MGWVKLRCPLLVVDKMTSWQNVVTDKTTTFECIYSYSAYFLFRCLMYFEPSIQGYKRTPLIAELCESTKSSLSNNVSTTFQNPTVPLTDNRWNLTNVLLVKKQFFKIFVGFKITQIEKSCLPPIRADVLQSVLIRKTQRVESVQQQFANRQLTKKVAGRTQAWRGCAYNLTWCYYWRMGAYSFAKRRFNRL